MRYILGICLLNIVFFVSPIQGIGVEIVTNPERSDGFGAQFQTIIASVIYAELTNKKFAYTPFKAMEHNYQNDSDFIAKKEWLINFIDNFEVNNGQAAKPEVNLIHFFEANLAQCINSAAFQKIKAIFRANKNINNYFNDKNLNIAIHMRRPNPHDSRLDGADTPDVIFLNIINYLRTAYAPQNPLFHIHSQGELESFRAFNAADIVLHLNESIEKSFTQMVLADVLVTSRSSFSYAAGIISEGTVYYIPFWHAPLPQWISIETI